MCDAIAIIGITVLASALSASIAYVLIRWVL